MLHFDAGNSSSFSGSGNKWNNLSSSRNNGTINSVSFNSTNKSFDFDGVGDYVWLRTVLVQGFEVKSINTISKPWIQTRNH